MPTQSPALEALDEGTRLRALRGALEDPRSVLEGVGALLVGRSQRAFREQRMASIKWKTRGETKMNPNWPGILRDFHEGKSSPPPRRFQPGPVLVDRGMLRRSVNFRVLSRDTVEAGSNLPYAGVLHAGGESETVPITATIQSNLWKWIKSKVGGAKRSARKAGKDKTPESRSKAADKLAVAESALRLKWLLNKNLTGERLTIKHPARPIVALPDDLVRDIESIYGRAVGSV